MHEKSFDAAPDAADGDVPALDRVVLDEVKELMGEKFALILELFLNETRNRFNSIEHALANSDAGKIARAAHALRAIAAHIGANAMAASAATLEDSAHKTPPAATANLAPHYVALKKNFEQARKEIELLLGNPPGA